jgi:hypothetical protein
MSMIGFPLLLIPLAVVNIVVFLMNLPLERLQDKVITVDLPSLKPWTITFSDVLLAFALFLLLLEVVKSARPGSKYVTDHLLSFVVFAAAAAEFLLLPQFAHATFFLLTLMALTDVVAGIWIRAVRPRPVAARVAPPPAGAERPVSRTAVGEPAPVPPKPPADVVEPLAEPRMAEVEPRMAEPHMAEPHAAEPHVAEHHVAEPHMVEPHMVEPHMVEPSPTHEMPATPEQRDVPIAPHQEILPPERTDTPRR